MSLFNLLGGCNPSTEQLFKLLGLSVNNFGRYRDIYVKDGYIVVHTRCGGGNREDYEEMFETVSTHPWYSHDEDYEYDTTYADIYFTIPNDENQTVVGLLDQGTPPAEKWDNFINGLPK